METVKFRCVSAFGEFEFEGPEEYVERNISKIESFVKLLSVAPAVIGSEKKESKPGKQANTIISNDIHVPEVFGEWMNTFKAKKLTDLDKALIAAFYIQTKATANEFKTNEISTTLSDHGIKIANPSITLKRLSDKKYMFQVRKEGNISFKRISDSGVVRIKELLSQKEI